MKTKLTTTVLTLTAIFSAMVSANAQAPERFLNVLQNIDNQVAPQIQVTPKIEMPPAVKKAPPSKMKPKVLPDKTMVVPERTVPQMYVAPSMPEDTTCQFITRLQFSGRMTPGFGMEVVHTDHGGVAKSIGLESGDVIVQINGRPIRTEADYRNALLNAARFNDGHLDLVVHNVRWYPGSTFHRQYVSLHADLPQACLVPAVAAR